MHRQIFRCDIKNTGGAERNGQQPGVSGKELKAYFMTHQERIARVMRLINPKSVTNAVKIRLGGGSGDGGYVLLKEPLKKGSIAYSIGIGETDQFEEAIEGYGYHIWMYDHTVNVAGFVKPSRIIQKIGIGPEDKGPLRTLGTLIKENGHTQEQDMLLQMDTEGSEWGVFSKMNPNDLKPFSMIVLEVHSLLFMFANPVLTQIVERAFKTLTTYHTPFHVHGNNYAGYFSLPHKPPLVEVLEISLVRKDVVEFTDCHETFPTRLDAPNGAGEPDIDLGYFQW